MCLDQSRARKMSDGLYFGLVNQNIIHEIFFSRAICLNTSHDAAKSAEYPILVYTTQVNSALIDWLTWR